VGKRRENEEEEEEEVSGRLAGKGKKEAKQ
jgi:hypothetical protein